MSDSSGKAFILDDPSARNILLMEVEVKTIEKVLFLYLDLRFIIN